MGGVALLILPVLRGQRADERDVELLAVDRGRTCCAANRTDPVFEQNVDPKRSQPGTS